LLGRPAIVIRAALSCGLHEPAAPFRPVSSRCSAPAGRGVDLRAA